MQSSSSALRTNDQYFSLTDQLNLGVRAVELDTHWVEVSVLKLFEPQAFMSTQGAVLGHTEVKVLCWHFTCVDSRLERLPECASRRRCWAEVRASMHISSIASP